MGGDGVFYGLSVSMTKLSRYHFAALLSFGITFLSHKFACIAIWQIVFPPLTTFWRSKLHLLAVRGRCVSLGPILMAKKEWKKKSSQSPVSTRGFSVWPIDWIHAMLLAFRGLYWRANSYYLYSIIDGCMMRVRCNFHTVGGVCLCVYAVFTGSRLHLMKNRFYMIAHHISCMCIGLT